MMLAKELIALHEAPRQVAPFSERYPGLTPQQGYDAARALHEHRLARGWKAVGRKIGFTNRTIWARYGVYEPMWGTLYDRTVIDASSGRARVPIGELVQPRIEPEICFKLRAAPRSAEPQALLECLEWIAHSIEIVQCHHPGWKVTIADCTADNGLHGRLIVGPAVPVPSISDLIRLLPEVQAVLKRDGQVVDRGVGENVLGSPLLALGHLVTVLAKQPQAAPLAAGEIVSTGVLSDAHPVSAGERWSTEIIGLPLAGLEIAFE